MLPPRNSKQQQAPRFFNTSVIIPVHNAEATIRATLESVFASSLRACEVIPKALDSPEAKKIKNPGPEDQALAIPRGDLLCWQLINLLKSQTSNYKLQTISNDQNSKIQTMSCPEKFWSLNIVI